MTTNPGFDNLNKQCERNITKMSDAEALSHISQLVDDAFDASFERGAKRALYEGWPGIMKNSLLSL